MDKAVGADRLPEEIESNFDARYLKKPKKKRKRKRVAGKDRISNVSETRQAQRRESYIDKAVGDDQIDVKAEV